MERFEMNSEQTVTKVFSEVLDAENTLTAYCQDPAPMKSGRDDSAYLATWARTVSALDENLTTLVELHPPAGPIK
jgi:hypothetical protein